jgi:hypothetical protein
MSNTSQKQTAKKPYKSPVLKNLGSYTALTQGEGGTVSDGMGNPNARYSPASS